MGEVTLFSVDFTLIFRGFSGFVFGFGLAAALTFSTVGRYLAKELTWVSVVIGVGGVMLLSWPGDWYTVAVVMAASSVGIIIRSLVLDSRGRGKDDTIFRSHKVKNGIDDATASLIWAWSLALAGAQSAPPAQAVIFNQMLFLIETARAHLAAARRGEEYTLPIEAKRIIKG